MNKITLLIIVIVIVLAGGYFLLKDSSGTMESEIKQSEVGAVNDVEDSSDGQIHLPTLSNNDGGQGNDSDVIAEKENEVRYTDNGYEPSTITIRKGESVIFKNKSGGRGMWTASARHPSHILYPEQGGCIGSMFDACRSVAPGQSWMFTFNIAGSWDYHNHVRPADTGTVVVK